MGNEGFLSLLLVMLAFQALAAYGPWLKSDWARLIGSLLLFPISGAVLALAIGLWQGYWPAGV